MANDYITFHDALTHMVDYERANPSAERSRFHRKAIFEAMRELPQEHPWSYYTQLGRINTVAPYSTGTVTFDYTGGEYERMLTLTSGTWPSWAAYGVIIIDNVYYEVAERINGSILQLSIHSNPQADITTASSYTLMRYRYLLPHDVWTVDQVNAENFWELDFVHPREWLSGHRGGGQTGTPSEYTILGSHDFQGCMDIAFYPYPSSAETYDFMYQRRLGKVEVQDEHNGTITVSQLSRTVLGDSTRFTQDMVGAILRTGDDARELPTGRDGANPYVAQRTVMSVESATQLTVDFDFTASSVGVKYVISSPIDLEVGVMGNVFYRCCENHLAKMTRMGGSEGLVTVDQMYRAALLKAKEADSRNTSPRGVGMNSRSRRLSDYPGYPAVADVD